MIVNLPNTPVIHEGESLVQAILSQSLYNHSRRSYGLACLYAEKKKIHFDEKSVPACLGLIFPDRYQINE